MSGVYTKIWLSDFKKRVAKVEADLKKLKAAQGKIKKNQENLSAFQKRQPRWIQEIYRHARHAQKRGI